MSLKSGDAGNKYLPPHFAFCEYAHSYICNRIKKKTVRPLRNEYHFAAHKAFLKARFHRWKFVK